MLFWLKVKVPVRFGWFSTHKMPLNLIYLSMIQISFFSHKDVRCLETIINNELKLVFDWLCANKLSLNVNKSNFVLFHPYQKKMVSPFSLCINDNPVKQEKYVKYLGILLDSNLTWKPHICEISKKVRRGIGILSKIRHYVNIRILIQLY